MTTADTLSRPTPTTRPTWLGSAASTSFNPFALLCALQQSLDPAELLAIFSRGLARHVPIEGLSLTYPEGMAHSGDGGLHVSGWPLVTRGIEVAMLRVHSGLPLTRQELGVLREATALLAQPMYNALSCERLRRHAQEDALTGLFNRATLTRMLPREVALAEREGTPLAVLMLDLDHFKAINDTHGHGLGDRALALLGEVLRTTLRRSDLAFRYGGEEFVIILPDTHVEGATLAARRIATTLRQQAEAELGFPITASIGIAAMPVPGEPATDAERLLTRADRALYLAKSQGRDRTLVA
ncbi:MAG: GGDEF domain-containing protein [Gammaproteobacteria bacterium]|nr:MAG: GGDEF domain-containing protein [Gammaproteobacteria bacterium]